MLFNSVDFLLFFPFVVIIYFFIPQKFRYIWLLICSYYFYMKWNPKYIFLLFGVTLITYLGGLLIERINKKNVKIKGKCPNLLVLTVCLILNLGILWYFKYFNFTLQCLNHAVQSLHLGQPFTPLDIILPVGISFYIFQALGYLIDIYRGEIYAERNFLRYALFVSFFPQLVAGPIERSKNLLAQLAKPVSFSYENLRKGLLLMLWGFYLKVVIADRAGMIVNTVYNGEEGLYQGIFMITAALLFPIQIYCDFHGYSTIARGAALVIGIRLTDNFQAPYFSKSIKEYWQRWHISLSNWFRDYLYIPLGGNRKGKLRKEINLLIVFGISGLWHGAATSFVIWGLLNGFYQIAGGFINDLKKKIRKAKESRIENSPVYNLLRQITTFLLTCFAFILFRAGGTSAAIRFLKSMAVWNWGILFNGFFYTLGIQKDFFIILLLAIIVLFIVDFQKYKEVDVPELFLNQKWGIRVFVEMALLYSVLLFGCYGELYDASEFIYFQF